jgi:putative flippase GtrA
MNNFFGKHWKKFCKFFIVGVLSTGLNFSVQAIFVSLFNTHYFFTGITYDDVAGIFGGMFLGYALNYYWTFKR